MGKETGYDPLASISYLDTSVLLFPGRERTDLVLEQVKLAEVVSLIDFSLEEPDFSWRIAFLIDRGDRDQVLGRAEGGIGLASPSAFGLVPYILLTGAVGTGFGSWGPGAGPGLTGGLLWRGGEFNVLTELRAQHWWTSQDLRGKSRTLADFALSFPSRDWELRLSGQAGGRRQWSLDLYRYF